MCFLNVIVFIANRASDCLLWAKTIFYERLNSLKVEQIGNALQAALNHGNEQIIRLLLSQGADVNAQEGFYGNALIAASEGGHKQIATLLLDHRANVIA